ncbi:hypothetical protein BDW69DRAFT_180501 [Aspergillus filifer]
MALRQHHRLVIARRNTRNLGLQRRNGRNSHRIPRLAPGNRHSEQPLFIAGPGTVFVILADPRRRRTKRGDFDNLPVPWYMTFIYGFIYLLFEAYPISFIEERHYTLRTGVLPFLSIGLGVILGSVYIFHFTDRTIRRPYISTGHIRPEERLYPMIPASILLPVGIFLFAWTSFPFLSIWGHIVAGVPLGAGIQTIYLQGSAYLVDVYTVNANSAISANAFVISTVAARFTKFATPMYHRLGPSTPIPVIFYSYGDRIRKMSRYAPTL